MSGERKSPAWRRILNDQIVLADFEAGGTLTAIAARYGLSRRALCVAWKRLGLQRRRGGARVVPSNDVLQQDLDSGVKQIVLAHHYGVSVGAVSNAWKRLGLSCKHGVNIVRRSTHPWGDRYAL